MVETAMSLGRSAWGRILGISIVFAAIFFLSAILSPPAADAAQTTVSWTAPTSHTDGMPASDLSGYKIYYGNTSGVYQQSVDVGNQLSYTLDSLADGATYYFAVTSYDTSGLESVFSTEFTKSFPALPATYTITASSDTGGSITALNNTKVSQATNGSTTVSTVSVNAGASQAFTIAPAPGYAVAGVSVDGVSVGPLSSYTFSNITANHTIAASFVANSFAITASAGTGGAITPSGTATLAAGSSQSYTIAAASGYSIADVKVDGVSAGPVASYSFSNVTSNHTIAASFAPNSLTITASAGYGGTITPAGTAAIAYGSSQSYAIAPAAGYRITGVKVDGVSVGAVASYSFNNVTASHTISASFAPNSFTITASAASGGTITPSGTATVAYGSVQSYAIAPAAGYRIADVKVDGVSVGAVATYSFNYVTAGHTISASFLANSFTITASAGTGGTITPSGTATVNNGASQSYTVAPAAGYSIADLKVDGISVGPVASYSFSNVTANHTIVASFAARTFTITASAGSGGSITPSGTATVNYGSSQSYTIASAAGYSIADVKIDGVSAGKLAAYTFSSITAGHTIQATFTANVVFAVNSAGQQFTDASGISYLADTKYTGGGTNLTAAAIAGTVDDTLYRSWRIGGNFSYNVPVANGNYLVTLKFADNATAAGQRIFNVSMEGKVVVANLDIYAKAGYYGAYDVTVPVSVTDGVLNIQFNGVVSTAKVNAIVVRSN